MVVSKRVKRELLIRAVWPMPFHACIRFFTRFFRRDFSLGLLAMTCDSQTSWEWRATTGNGRLWHGHCDFYATPQSYAWLWLQASNFLSFWLSDLCPSSSHSHNSHHCLVSFAKTEPVSTPCSGPRMEQYLPAAATRCKMMQRSNRPPSLTPNQQQG